MAPSLHSKTVKKAAKKPTKAKTAKANSSIEDVELRIISGMAERYHVFGLKEVSMTEVLKFAGYAYPTAARFHQTKKSLLSKGELEYLAESKSFSLTEKGLSRAPKSESNIRTNEAFHAHLKESFKSPKAAAILDLLADGSPHDRSTICGQVGYKYQTAPAFAKSLKELRELGLLDSPQKGMIQLTDKAFLPNQRPVYE